MEISSLITHNFKTMSNNGDCHGAITAFLPYAVWQEQDAKPEMLDILLCAARSSRMLSFKEYHIKQFASTLLYKASPRAIVLVSPYISWDKLKDKEDGRSLVQQWATATSEVLHTEEEVGWRVVDTLFQIASESQLLPHITFDVWLWLTELSSLPPICQGRFVGTRPQVVKAVQALKDIKVLKSYFLLVWSEWGWLASQGFEEMCTSVRNDFGEVRMGHHRTELIQRLDYILGQLDLGLAHLKQHNPQLGGFDLQMMKGQYGKLQNILNHTQQPLVTAESAVQQD